MLFVVGKSIDSGALPSGALWQRLWNILESEKASKFKRRTVVPLDL